MRKSILAVAFAAITVCAFGVTEHRSVRSKDAVLTFDPATEISETAVKGIIFEDSGGNIRTQAYDEVTIQWSDFGDSIIDPDVLQTQITENAIAIDAILAGGAQVGVTNPVAMVVAYGSNITYHTTLRDAAEAAGKGEASIHLLRPFTFTNNVLFQANPCYFYGNNIPFSGVQTNISVGNHSWGGSAADPKATIEFEGSVLRFSDVRYMGRQTETVDGALNAYCWNLDTTTDVLFEDCNIMYYYEPSVVNGNIGLPKNITATTQVSVRFSDCALGIYASNPTNDQNINMIDTHTGASGYFFNNTKFYSNWNARKSSINFPFNTAATIPDEDDFFRCSYMTNYITTSSGGIIPCDTLTLNDVKSLAFPGTESLFTASDITSGLSEVVRGEIKFEAETITGTAQRGRATREIELDVLSTVANNYSTYLMERIFHDSANGGADSFLYTKTFFAPTLEASSTGSILVGPYDASLRTGGETMRVFFRPNSAPTDEYARLGSLGNTYYGATNFTTTFQITLSGSITVSDGDLIEAGSYDFWADGNQTGSTIDIRDYYGATVTDLSGGEAVSTNGVGAGVTFTSQNLALTTGGWGWFRASDGLHMAMRFSGPIAGVVETMVRIAD
jgi:hypothetical protein